MTAGCAVDEPAADGGFPLVVAALSTVTALALFFTATIPAIQEEQHLRSVEVERWQVHTGLRQDIEDAATQAMALRIDVQSLMVELDRQGIFTGAVVAVDQVPEGTAPEGTDPGGTGPKGTGPKGTGPKGTGPKGIGRNADGRNTDARRVAPRGAVPGANRPRPRRAGASSRVQTPAATPRGDRR